MPARVLNNPADELRTTPSVVSPASVTEVLAVTVVKVPAAAVPPPIAPGAAKVAPFKEEAFRLATLVVEATTKGAVPVARVEVNWLFMLMVVIPERAPELMIKPLIVLTAVAPVIAPERFNVVTPDTAPAVETSQVLESMATLVELLPKVVTPVELNVVKAPVDGVEAPICVALIPVAVVLKVEAPVPEVIVRALVP